MSFSCPPHPLARWDPEVWELKTSRLAALRRMFLAPVAALLCQSTNQTPPVLQEPPSVAAAGASADFLSGHNTLPSEHGVISRCAHTPCPPHGHTSRFSQCHCPQLGFRAKPWLPLHKPEACPLLLDSRWAQPVVILKGYEGREKGLRGKKGREQAPYMSSAYF